MSEDSPVTRKIERIRQNIIDTSQEEPGDDSKGFPVQTAREILPVPSSTFRPVIEINRSTRLGYVIGLSAGVTGGVGNDAVRVRATGDRIKITIVDGLGNNNTPLVTSKRLQAEIVAHDVNVANNPKDGLVQALEHVAQANKVIESRRRGGKPLYTDVEKMIASVDIRREPDGRIMAQPFGTGDLGIFLWQPNEKGEFDESSFSFLYLNPTASSVKDQAGYFDKYGPTGDRSLPLTVKPPDPSEIRPGSIVMVASDGGIEVVLKAITHEYEMMISPDLLHDNPETQEALLHSMIPGLSVRNEKMFIKSLDVIPPLFSEVLNKGKNSSAELELIQSYIKRILPTASIYDDITVIMAEVMSTQGKQKVASAETAKDELHVKSGENLTFNFAVSSKDTRSIVPIEDDGKFARAVIRADEELKKKIKEEGIEDTNVAKKVEVATKLVHFMFPDYNKGQSRIKGVYELPADLLFHFVEDPSTDTQGHTTEIKIYNTHDDIVERHRDTPITVSELIPYAICSTQSIFLHTLLAQEGIRSYVAVGRFYAGTLRENGKVDGRFDGEDHAVVVVPLKDWNESNPWYTDQEALQADPVCGFSATVRDINSEYKRRALLSAKVGDVIPQGFNVIRLQQLFLPN